MRKGIVLFDNIRRAHQMRDHPVAGPEGGAGGLAAIPCGSSAAPSAQPERGSDLLCHRAPGEAASENGRLRHGGPRPWTGRLRPDGLNVDYPRLNRVRR
jgi:hypothetical protein